MRVIPADHLQAAGSELLTGLCLRNRAHLALVASGQTAARLGRLDEQSGRRSVRRRPVEMAAQKADHLGRAQVAVHVDHDQSLRRHLHLERSLHQQTLLLNCLEIWI